MSARGLYQAALLGDINEVRRLLGAGANPNDFIALRAPQTPIYGAVRYIDILELLIGSGADPKLGYDVTPEAIKINLLDAARRATMGGSICMRAGKPTADPYECYSYIEELLYPGSKAQFLAQEAFARAAQAAEAAKAAQAAEAAKAAQAAAAEAAPNTNQETVTESTANTGENQTGPTVGGRRTRPRRKTRRRRQPRRKSYR